MNTNWQTIAASVCGASHKRTGMPCQDAHCWEVLPQGILIAAVADGAGSAALAEIGSTIASRTALATIRSRLENSLLPEADSCKLFLTEAMEAARFAIEAEAKLRDAEPRDLATTLILVIASPKMVVATQIGDGAIVAGDALGNIISITRPQFGEYLNETTFITSAEAIETAQVIIWSGDLSYISVLSDGLQLLALQMPEGTPYLPFFSSLFQFISDSKDIVEAQKELEAFLCSERVAQRADDDLTLLLAKLAA